MNKWERWALLVAVSAITGHAGGFLTESALGFASAAALVVGVITLFRPEPTP